MKRRGLTPEEQSLWRRATRDVSRLRPAPEQALPDATDRRLRMPEKPSIDKTMANGPLLKTVGQSRPAPDPFAAGDPRKDRLVARGRMPIDAVIDLHGHTQATARRTLLTFLINARNADKRCVLVITGKGATGGARGMHGLGGGILRVRFGDWLNEDPFRALVVRASPAHRRHGGGGAFYVFLKSRSARKP